MATDPNSETNSSFDDLPALQLDADALAEIAAEPIESPLETEPPPPDDGSPKPIIDVRISDDRLHAYLTITQDPPEPYQVTAKAIMAALRNKNFKHGINQEEIAIIVAGRRYPQDQLIGTLPPPRIGIDVSKDRLKAFLTIKQKPPEPYQPTLEMLLDALAENNIVHGVKEEELAYVIGAQTFPTNLLVAEGIPPTPGSDAVLQYLFDTEGGGKARDLGYRVDHYDLGLVHNVKEGDVLVRKIPMDAGAPGTSVHGKPLHPPKVKDVRLPVGKGTEISPDNNLDLVAAIDGFIRVDKKNFKQLLVEQVFTNYGSVDMSTGNLEIEGNILITEDVREGFRVDATGDITINGVAERCSLKSGGDVVVKGGIIGGRSKAIILSEGDVIAKFVDQARVISGGSIIIKDESINSTLQAEKKVIVGNCETPPGAIVGGVIYAGESVCAFNIGASIGTRTRLRVGERPALVTRKRELQSEIHAMKQEMVTRNIQIKNLTEKLSERMKYAEMRKVTRQQLEARQHTLYHETQRLLLAKVQAEGVSVMPEEAIQVLDEEVKDTQSKLKKIESQINFLQNRFAIGINLSNADMEKLDKLKILRQRLITNLNETESVLKSQQKRLNRVPKNLLRDLQMSGAALEEVRNQLVGLKKEDAMDSKFGKTILQLTKQREQEQQTLGKYQAELDEVLKKLEETQQLKPTVTAKGTLYRGVEVKVLGKNRRITITEKNVQVKLSTDDDPEVIVMSMASGAPKK